jgi:hypothetical protein
MDELTSLDVRGIPPIRSPRRPAATGRMGHGNEGFVPTEAMS